MRIAVLAAFAASLAGCSASPVEWNADTVPVVLTAPPLALAPPCPSLDAAITAEAKRMTPIRPSDGGNTDALTAALLSSEAAKNARLRQALLAYERCRGRR